MRARLLLPAALSLLPAAPPAQAATLGSGTTETFLGCPAGFGLVTAPDPRALAVPTAFSAPRAEQQIVVQCVSLQTSIPPACPAGTTRAFLSGPDTCNQPRRSSSTSTVSDGTSNTVFVGEAPPPTAPATAPAKTATTRFSSVPSPVYPTCVAPAALVIDPSGQMADNCVIRTVVLPADRVPVSR